MSDHTAENQGCIPEAMLPHKGVHQVQDPKTGAQVLLVNSVMFTGYQHAQGQLSESFFIPLRDQTKLMGRKCPSCGEVDCPPFQLMCPYCDFVAMEPVELPDRGLMMASAPITLFANAFFKEKAPFARGYVQLGGANTGLNVWCRTTTGMIRPGIFTRGTPVKVVFEDVRQGLITDLCVVPEAELTPAQIAKSPLFTSEVNWRAIKRPEYAPSPAAAEHFQRLLSMAPAMETAIKGSRRAKADLANWDVVVNGHSAGFDFHITVHDDLVKFRPGQAEGPSTFEIAVPDPQVFVDWWETGAALTNLLMDGTMWMSDSLGLETIFKLDRLPRSIRREEQARSSG
jgi:uncharacterized OB-fold protein